MIPTLTVAPFGHLVSVNGGKRFWTVYLTVDGRQAWADVTTDGRVFPWKKA